MIVREELKRRLKLWDSYTEEERWEILQTPWGELIADMEDPELARKRETYNILSNIQRHNLVVLRDLAAGYRATANDMFARLFRKTTEYVLSHSGYLDEFIVVESYAVSEWRDILAPSLQRHLDHADDLDTSRVCRLAGFLAAKICRGNDAGDYLATAMENLHQLTSFWVRNNWDEFDKFCGMTEDYPEGACDGECRYGWYYWVYCDDHNLPGNWKDVFHETTGAKREDEWRRWSSLPPTQEGHYWVEFDYGECHVFYAYHDNQGELCISYHGLVEKMDPKPLRWAGPVPEPLGAHE